MGLGDASPRHPGVAPTVLSMLQSARRGLAEAADESAPGARYVTAHLAALRAAAAVVAARGEPRSRRRKPHSVWELLPGDATPTPLVPTPKLVIDLERMGQLPKDKVGPLARYVATIQSQRGDYNGRVLSVRHEDLRSLAVIYDKSPADLTEELISWGVLDADARGAMEGF